MKQYQEHIPCIQLSTECMVVTFQHLVDIVSLANHMKLFIKSNDILIIIKYIFKKLQYLYERIKGSILCLFV